MTVVIESPWKKHVLTTGGDPKYQGDEPPAKPKELKHNIEPWLAALFQAEHLNLLIGNGLTRAIAMEAGVTPADMAPRNVNCHMSEAVDKAIRENAARCHRGEANVEDQIRVMLDLIGGLKVLSMSERLEIYGKSVSSDPIRQLLKEWESELEATLAGLLTDVLSTEDEIRKAIETDSEEGRRAQRLFRSFLLPFASRTASRERLHIFTTNYDRLIEYGCDLLGLRILDRFIGQTLPVFRSSRLRVDLHYNPPGIRGEPRYLEGVVRLTKLHGSVDWRQWKHPYGRQEIRRYGIPFGPGDSEFRLPLHLQDSLIIYPNPAKDIETLEYPYADLFRDFAAAVCQPNSVVVAFGYGFGDDHINRILRDMLTIPSTHVVIISYDTAGGKVEQFYNDLGLDEQITLLIGDHFGGISTLVEHYLPKPAIDKTTMRMIELIDRRTPHKEITAEKERSEPEVPE